MSAVEVAYSVEGEGPPLYLVHGIGARKTIWAGVVERLRDAFTCVAHDLRGHGESPVPPPPYAMANMVEDLEALRVRLGHERIHVAGHSLGGMIGPSYARAHPRHTRSVGLLSTAAGRSEKDREVLQALIARMEQGGVEPQLDALVDRWFMDEFRATHPEAVALRLQQVVDTPEPVFLSVFHMYAETEMGPWLGEIECPCLVLTGELDGGCNPRLNQFITEQLADAKLVILDQLKHAVLIEAPDRVAAALREFLLGQDA